MLSGQEVVREGGRLGFLTGKKKAAVFQCAGSQQSPAKVGTAASESELHFSMLSVFFVDSSLNVFGDLGS